MKLVCTHCTREETAETRQWRCVCGGPFILDYRPEPWEDTLDTARWDLWRYGSSLPVTSPIVTLGEGMTPLVTARLGGGEILLKCEFCNPTGSYKDRGWTVAVSHFKAQGIDAVVEDSSGNAGASLAAYGARAGIQVTVFVPHDSPVVKRRQILAHGGRVVEVEGGREAVAAACLTAAEKTYYAGHAWNPWFLHGPRTLAWELMEQNGGTPPGIVFTPVGQGGVLLGLYHGFKTMVDSGRLSSLPRLVAVQTTAYDPVVRGWREKSPSIPPSAGTPTLADAIRTPQPVRYQEIQEALQVSGGTALSVDEDAIKETKDTLSRLGFFVEPTSAVAAAGALQWLQGSPEPLNGPVVVVLTGHGLKAIAPETVT